MGSGSKAAGFTLAEILVTLMILGILMSAIAPILLSSKLLLKKSFGRAEAIEVASMKMEQSMAKSYSGLLPSSGMDCLTSAGWLDSASAADCAGRAGRPFNWRVAVSALSAGVTPYKQVQVTVSYVDENSQTQVVSLMNYVTYPYIHVISNNIPAGAVVTPSYQRLYSVPVTFSTKKSIQLSYNLAIRVNNAANIQALDTVYTLARLVKNGSVLAYFYPETRTPIMTQPLINNWVELDGLSLQGCTLEILWHKETAVPGAGVVTLKTGNVIVIAVEDKS